MDREPSVVAVDSNGEAALAVGAEAQKMLGRTPGNITAVKPLKEGVISDYSTAERMLQTGCVKKPRETALWERL